MAADETVPVQRRRRRKKRGCCQAVFLPWLKRKLCTWNLFTQYLLYFAGMWLYLLVGGLVFWLVEHPNEEKELENAIEERNRFTAELASDLNQTFGETEAFIDYISTLCDQDIFIGELDTIPRKWEYGPSVFFAMTVITTIGYGTLAPVTTAGQILFCVYALFGIPLFLFFMALLGGVLSDAWDKTMQRWIIRNNKTLRCMSFFLLLGLGCFLFLALPAIVFAVVDDFTYTTSLYFVAVTLTTVGFGDILPIGPRDTFLRGLYVIGITGWLFLGLTFVSVMFTKVSKFYEKADNAIATKMVSGLVKRRRFHPCGCLRGQDCSAKVKAGTQSDDDQSGPQADDQSGPHSDKQSGLHADGQLEHNTEAENEKSNESETDPMKINDVEGGTETELITSL